MADNYFFTPALLDEIQIPERGILSVPLYTDEHVKLVLFAFAAGHEISAHATPMAATMHFLSGEAEVVLGNDKRIVRAGGLAHMPPNLSHAITAITPTVMLLVMLKGPQTDSAAK